MAQHQQHTSSPGANEATISIPSVLVFFGILFFTIRYFFFSAAANDSSANSASESRRGGPAVSREKIEHLSQMFPQLSRRDIEWDLLHNGGSVQTTSERVLREGRLHPAPPNFRAQPDPATAGTASGNDRAGSGTGGRARAAEQPNLISRYNLTSRLDASSSGAGASDRSKGKGRANELGERGGNAASSASSKAKPAWSNNKTERQSMLQRRREEMVLAARRKMEAKDREDK